MGTSQSPGTYSPEGKLSGISLFLVASAVYLLCMIPYFVGYLPDSTTSLVGPPGDNFQDFWNTWYSQRVWDTGASGFFHTHIIRYPEGISLYYQTFAYSDLLLIFLIRKLFFLSEDLHVLAALHNGALLASIYLSALGAFYLARRFTRHTISALLAGFVFGFSPFHVSHFLAHMHVATIQFIPFFVLCFLRAVETSRPIHVAGSIFFYFLSAISSWYFLVLIGYFLVFYYVYQTVLERKLVVRRALAMVLGNLAGVLLLLSPILIPMVSEGWRNPYVYAPGGEDFVADALAYFVFDPFHLICGIGRTVYPHFTGNLVETRVYLGVINLALFAWAFFQRKRLGFKEMPFLVSGIVVFMLLASGPYLHVYGHSILPLPTRLLQFLPFISNMRASARAAVFVYLLFGIGAGLGMDAVIQWCRRRGRSSALWLTPVCLLVFLDFYPLGLASTPLESPRAYALLARDKDTDFGILDLPRGYLQGCAYMMYQTFHHRPIVGGTLSRKVARTLNDNLETKDMAEQKRVLIEKKVKYIFIHQDWVSAQEPLETLNIPAYGLTYPAVYLDADCVVLRVY